MKLLPSITLLFLLLFATGAQAQPLRIKENKYKINLPEYWKHGNKVWRKLTERLPQICEELVDKDLCGDDCNPRYTVDFYMTPPVVEDYNSYVISPNPAGNPPTDTWEFVTYYHFECYLLLYDNKTQELLTKVIVVDSNELWTVKNRVSLQNNATTPPSAYSPRNLPVNAQGPPLAFYSPGTPNWSPQRTQTPFSYINKNANKLAPQEKDQLFIVDNKFKDLE
ncbi:MAG: hypothetical protein NTW29_20155 [Bacteroidetes bacterium]|nr:hypothetical protein [Bacteroidota bacterium]